MRRNDKEIKDKKCIEQVLKKAIVCRIALCDNNKPYIVPMNFGFNDNFLYLHSAREGRKIDLIKENNNVCFEIDILTEVLSADNACSWGMKYYSVIGFGKAQFIETEDEKKNALDTIMQKYSPNSPKSFEYSKSALDKTALIKVEIESLTGKKSGY
ncbi:pyridoxamine 5'-phosphate oxidase family protein [Methanobacterium sp.]|uniref:pyridoxamine 5'-phosphate oxidase family protein n=1 Tax=Methanobacterium sp. TaxID=2164 RepID=UPI003C76584B